MAAARSIDGLVCAGIWAVQARGHVKLEDSRRRVGYVASVERAELTVVKDDVGGRLGREDGGEVNELAGIVDLERRGGQAP